MDDHKLQRDLARIEEMRRRSQEHLDKQQARLNERLKRIQVRIDKKYGNPNITQKRIIDAALTLLEEDGLSALSLRKLATRLNMQAPALYWHFKSKDVLIDYLAEAILSREFTDFTPRQDDEVWQDWLVGICQRLRQAMLRYRDGGRIVTGAHLYPALTLMRLFETAMQSLVSAGMSIQEANLIISTTVHFVFGNVIETQSMPNAEEIRRVQQSNFFADFPLMQESMELSMRQAANSYDEFEDSVRLIVGYASEPKKV